MTTDPRSRTPITTAAALPALGVVPAQLLPQMAVRILAQVAVPTPSPLVGVPTLNPKQKLHRIISLARPMSRLASVPW